MKQASCLAIATWVLLLTGIFTAGWLRTSSDTGDELTRNTVRLSLAYYAAAAGLMLYLRPTARVQSARARLARWCWSLAWAAYVVHVATAFHYYHHWSHDDAVRHTEAVSGFGPGIYVSHLFTLVWTADVLWWWLRPTAYASRPAWIGRSLHIFMAFIIFNGTVVYESGPIRWAGVLLFVALGAMCLHSRMRAAARDDLS